MSEGLSTDSPEIRAAYAEYDREQTLANVRVGCWIGIVLMPAGVILDRYVYPEQTLDFFQARILCSLVIGVFFGVAVSPIGRRHHRFLGVTLAMFPTICIAWMIYATDGPRSPYYAGLNLVLLVVGFVLHWTVVESLVAFALVMAMYLAACTLNGSDPAAARPGIYVNNLYFLAVTGVIVVTGNYFQSRLRYQEFAVRFQLGQSRTLLEENHRKLVELDRMKSRFFANISHELRTPLTLLLAPLESVMNRSGRTWDPETSALFSTMHANGMRLLKLINDLLDLVRLESGRIRLHREPVRVAEFIAGLGAAIRRVAEDKRIRFRVDPGHAGAVAVLDRDKMEKVLLNLLFNAVKFTPVGGRVDLRASTTDRSVVVEVQDTGVGIDAADLPYVFDRFWQADSSSQRKYQGAGIGLALVRELVDAQGGTVVVNSRKGHGTTMIVEVPGVGEPAVDGEVPVGARGPEASSSSSPAGDGDEFLAGLYRRAELFPALAPLESALPPLEVNLDPARPKVLVADDEPDMLRFLRQRLGREWTVIEAVDGRQAIEKASQFLPDVAVIDMMMPERDGMDVCRELRARTSTREIPLIILTARADDETKLAALSAGASDFLTKPFSSMELEVRVRNFIELRRFQREVRRQKQILESTLERLKETEAELVQSEKMASLGRLSAGIMHEINNPLNYMKTNLFALRRVCGSVPEEGRQAVEEILADVEDGLERVRVIASDLRSFAHPDPQRFDAVEVESVVGLAFRFLSNQLDPGPAVEREIPSGLLVRGNRNQIVQVLVNLFQNSIDAVRLRASGAEPARIRVSAKEREHGVEIGVWDNGPGVKAEHQAKLFEPFFTTKDAGQGMGLGLSICYRIMADHGGKIRFRSEPGAFCEFTLEFPKMVQASE